MRVIRVATWAELDDALFASSWDERLKRHRSRFAFRGMKDATAGLHAGVAHLGPDSAPLEEALLRTFRRYARRLANVDESMWSWLSLAQHHGLPTRLIDWTFSPYVALHFMTEDTTAFDRDGVIWAVDFIAARTWLPRQLAAILDEENANVFTTDSLARGAPSLRDLDALAEEQPEGFIVFLEPPSLDERIVSQYALFSFGPRASGACSAQDLEPWLVERPELSRKIIVPAALKWEIRDRLDQSNVTERVLYPGLDGLTRWLARYYAPR